MTLSKYMPVRACLQVENEKGTLSTFNSFSQDGFVPCYITVNYQTWRTSLNTVVENACKGLASAHKNLFFDAEKIHATHSNYSKKEQVSGYSMLTCVFLSPLLVCMSSSLSCGVVTSKQLTPPSWSRVTMSSSMCA